jgi:hypothetical protein
MEPKEHQEEVVKKFLTAAENVRQPTKEQSFEVCRRNSVNQSSSERLFSLFVSAHDSKTQRKQKAAALAVIG